MTGPVPPQAPLAIRTKAQAPTRGRRVTGMTSSVNCLLERWMIFDRRRLYLDLIAPVKGSRPYEPRVDRNSDNSSLATQFTHGTNSSRQPYTSILPGEIKPNNRNLSLSENLTTGYSETLSVSSLQLRGIRAETVFIEKTTTRIQSPQNTQPFHCSAACRLRIHFIVAPAVPRWSVRSKDSSPQKHIAHRWKSAWGGKVHSRSCTMTLRLT